MGAKPRKPKICLQLVWQRDANAFDHVKIFVLATFWSGAHYDEDEDEDKDENWRLCLPACLPAEAVTANGCCWCWCWC